MNISNKMKLWYRNEDKLYILGNCNRLSIEIEQTTVHHRDYQRGKLTFIWGYWIQYS